MSPSSNKKFQRIVSRSMTIVWPFWRKLLIINDNSNFSWYCWFLSSSWHWTEAFFIRSDTMENQIYFRLLNKTNACFHNTWSPLISILKLIAIRFIASFFHQSALNIIVVVWNQTLLVSFFFFFNESLFAIFWNKILLPYSQMWNLNLYSMQFQLKWV